MRTVQVNLGDISYPIHVGYGLLKDLGALYRERNLGRRVAVVTDSVVAGHHLRAAVESLSAAGIEVCEVTIPAGEVHKTLDAVKIVYDALVDARLDRGSALVALGGGVVGDVGGFAAATFLRGIDFVQVPTTIVSQVDASVGGKTGVDHRGGKNLIGAFHQPRLVCVDTSLLRTLPEREIRAGLAEVIKHAVIRDEVMFALLEACLEDIVEMQLAPDETDALIARNCRIKAEVVQADPFERTGLRAILNYGHTVGHAIEAATDYGVYLHGEAVLLGMASAGKIALDRGLWPGEDFDRQARLLKRLGIPPGLGRIPTEKILERMKSDKKARDGVLTFILPTRIGGVTTSRDVTPEEVLAGIEYAKGLSGE
ncbi:MAG: 3-dehydroquinate synthase [Candidatus Latescibacteria bacterium]|nr:3-dehydroquinate synthase [Candidatus Latescibacterota bacterium]